MIILSIETSCDETAVSILDCRGSVANPKFRVLGNALYSQVKIHAKYGGVYPNLAKREHQKNLIPLLKVVLKESNFFELKVKSEKLKVKKTKILKILDRERELLKQFMKLVPKIKKPPIQAIAVTAGPGLEPTLWVGINFAKALSSFWDIPLIPVNHMEGHFLSVLMNGKEFSIFNFQFSNKKIEYPALALLISGGHTELVYAKRPLQYKVIGRTRDDAVGETYDKVARMLSLPYPGGPQISRLASQARKLKMKNEKPARQSGGLKIKLPRPMINFGGFDFSFAGLKTAVLYKIKNINLSETRKWLIAKEFEDAVSDVLIAKTRKALELFKPKTLIVAGGVIANSYLRLQFENLIKGFPKTKLQIPLKELSTDNSVMIAIAGYLQIKRNPKILRGKRALRAQGNLSL